MRGDFNNHCKRMEATEQRLDQTITDTKYWLDNYSKSFKESDRLMNKVQSDVHGRIEAVEFQLSRRVHVEDMQSNFKVLNHMLFVKFAQLEDMK